MALALGIGFSIALFLGSAGTVNAQNQPSQNNGGENNSQKDNSWKGGFAACTGTSPYIDALISRDDLDFRPLMKIGAMQAWAVRDEKGKPATALTTDDGLTIIGRIIGPQGEDISAALLATRPEPSFLTGKTRLPAPANARTGSRMPKVLKPEDLSLSGQETKPDPRRSDAGDIGGGPLSQSEYAPVSPALSKLASKGEIQLLPEKTTDEARDDVVETSPSGQSAAPITAAGSPSPQVQAGMDLLLEQAAKDRIWFSASTPKPNAPVVYMLADPECPHCQWTIDKMHGPIASGAIDLRIVFAPITGVAGFNTSLSILHSNRIPQTFMAHMTSKTRGTETVTQMDTSQADRAVVQGIVDNINWMRANRMPGVPFFLYQTDQGAKFAFSELPADILKVAKAPKSPRAQ